jgi:hypothetical protein
MQDQMRRHAGMDAVTRASRSRKLTGRAREPKPGRIRTQPLLRPSRRDRRRLRDRHSGLLATIGMGARRRRRTRRPPPSRRMEVEQRQQPDVAPDGVYRSTAATSRRPSHTPGQAQTPGRYRCPLVHAASYGRGDGQAPCVGPRKLRPRALAWFMAILTRWWSRHCRRPSHAHTAR